MTELNLAEADLPALIHFSLYNYANINSVSLRNAVVNQESLASLINGGPDSYDIGIGEFTHVTNLDLSGIDFAEITDLSVFYSCPDEGDCRPGYGMNDLTDLWLVNTENLDAVALDGLLDDLETIESPDTEGVLYMTRANYNAFNAAGGGLLSDWNDEPGHHVEFVPVPSTRAMLLIALAMIPLIARQTAQDGP
jgi:hypothetical protein